MIWLGLIGLFLLVGLVAAFLAVLLLLAQRRLSSGAAPTGAFGTGSTNPSN